MTSYLIKRTLIMLFTIAVVSIASFATIQLPPGDYATKLYSQIAGAHPRTVWSQPARARSVFQVDSQLVSRSIWLLLHL